MSIAFLTKLVSNFYPITYYGMLKKYLTCRSFLVWELKANKWVFPFLKKEDFDFGNFDFSLQKQKTNRYVHILVCHTSIYMITL